MGITSFWHLLIILVVVLLVFGGGGRLSKTMGDFGKGMRALREGLKSDDEVEREKQTAQAKSIGHAPAAHLPAAHLPTTPVSGSAETGAPRRDDTTL